MKHKFSQIGFYTAPAQNPPFSHTRHEPSEEVCVCVCVCRGANVSENVTFTDWPWLVVGQARGAG